MWRLYAVEEMKLSGVEQRLYHQLSTSQAFLRQTNISLKTRYLFYKLTNVSTMSSETFTQKCGVFKRLQCQSLVTKQHKSSAYSFCLHWSRDMIPLSDNCIRFIIRKRTWFCTNHLLGCYSSGFKPFQKQNKYKTEDVMSFCFHVSMTGLTLTSLIQKRIAVD